MLLLALCTVCPLVHGSNEGLDDITGRIMFEIISGESGSLVSYKLVRPRMLDSLTLQYKDDGITNNTMRYTYLAEGDNVYKMVDNKYTEWALQQGFQSNTIASEVGECITLFDSGSRVYISKEGEQVRWYTGTRYTAFM
ncbi:uncharacterized protein V2V93DRAFT_376426 [Kockiozyma suomiensis]|uniref:uncharacterized protein n=1 Tax=Kockiozyma suomiensis TaxID=1337062 RepID=UPI003343F7BB